MADTQGLCDVMVGEHDRGPRRGSFPQQSTEAFGTSGVDSGEGLVANEDARPGDERPSELEAPALTPRELSGTHREPVLELDGLGPGQLTERGRRTGEG